MEPTALKSSSTLTQSLLPCALVGCHAACWTGKAGCGLGSLPVVEHGSSDKHARELTEACGTLGDQHLGYSVERMCFLTGSSPLLRVICIGGGGPRQEGQQTCPQSVQVN